MSNRWAWLAAVLASVAANGVELRAAAAVEVQLYPLSGDVRLYNPDGTDFQFVYYELKSAANSFTQVPAAWTSIADTYDASGNGFVDPINEWIELSATASEISEALFTGSGSRLPARRSIGLGKIWDSEAVLPNDVTSTMINASLQTIQVPVVIALSGDYNRDLVVDSGDYNVWRLALNAVNMPDADGNFDGIVDAADYTVWRDNFGHSLLGLGYGGLSGGGSSGIGSGVVVPEPASGLLALFSAFGLLVPRRRHGAPVSV